MVVVNCPLSIAESNLFLARLNRALACVREARSDDIALQLEGVYLGMFIHNFMIRHSLIILVSIFKSGQSLDIRQTIEIQVIGLNRFANSKDRQ